MWPADDKCAVRTAAHSRSTASLQLHLWRLPPKCLKPPVHRTKRRGCSCSWTCRTGGARTWRRTCPLWQHGCVPSHRTSGPALTGRLTCAGRLDSDCGGALVGQCTQSLEDEGLLDVGSMGGPMARLPRAHLVRLAAALLKVSLVRLAAASTCLVDKALMPLPAYWQLNSVGCTPKHDFAAAPGLLYYKCTCFTHDIIERHLFDLT